MEEQKTEPTAEARRECFFCDTLPRISRAFDRYWSEATQGHFRNSRIEFLKGIRSLLDDRIAHLSRTETRGTKVTVE
jgi:hypothetical protein